MKEVIMMKYKKKIIDNEPIRVLYKRTGKAPVVKIIFNVSKLKRLIVKKTLKMIRYEDYIIVCLTSKQNVGNIPNVILNFGNISGDFFFIGYNSKTKNFRSLNLKEIEFYVEELNRKSFNVYKYKRFVEKNKKNIVTSNFGFVPSNFNNIQVEDDKITIKPVEENNSLDSREKEFQKRAYEILCTKFGLDSSRGEIVFEKSADKNTKKDIDVNWKENKIVLSPTEFNRYKDVTKMEEKEKSEVSETNESKSNIQNKKNNKNNQESLELILRIQNDILKFIKNAMDSDENE